MFPQHFARAAVLAVLLCPSAGFAADPPSGPVAVDNDSGGPVWVHAESYLDAAGKRVALDGFWAFKAGEKARLLAGGQPITAREFRFSITTADGQSTGWEAKALNAAGELRSSLNADTLAAHRRVVADQRERKAAGVGVGLVYVPAGGRVSVGTWKAPVNDGAALLTSPRTDAGKVSSYVVTVEFDQGGRTFKDERVMRLEPNQPLEWDCRDVAAPDKMGRTARYVWECREVNRREYAKLGKEPTPAAEAVILAAVAAGFDAVPTRGVDEDAVRQNQATAAAFAKLAKEVKAGAAGRAEMDVVFEELKTQAGRTRGLLEARYGDAYQQALANGGKVAASRTVVAAYTPPAVTGSAADPAADRRAKLDADIRTAEAAVRAGETKLSEVNNKLLAARGGLVLANRAYERADGLGQELLAGAAVATARRIIDELDGDKSSIESDLKSNRDRLNRLRSER